MFSEEKNIALDCGEFELQTGHLDQSISVAFCRFLQKSVPFGIRDLFELFPNVVFSFEVIKAVYFVTFALSDHRFTTAVKLISKQCRSYVKLHCFTACCNSHIFAFNVSRDIQPDLLQPTKRAEKRKYKTKRLVQSPNSFFMDVKCPGCFQMYDNFSTVSVMFHLIFC